MGIEWIKVARILEAFADTSPVDHSGDALLDHGQQASLAELGLRIRAGRRMVLLADEVGMGKTRIAVALIQAVRQAGGRTAIVIPAGLGAQWQAELRRFDSEDRTLLPLRSFTTFLDSFLQEGDVVKERWRRARDDRKLQRELPEGRLADEKILMISHSFAAMRFTSEGTSRRQLLGEIRHFMGRGSLSRRLNDGWDPAMVRAADTIAETMRQAGLAFDPVVNPAALPADEYKRRILPLIGLGLGPFDLVIVDEAHKSRGTDSSLSRILGPVTWETDDPFRLGMTATPVELDAQQWKDTIARISGREDGANLSGLEALDKPLQAYVDVFKRLQREDLDEPLVQAFEAAAQDFHKALCPYVLRRDKRDDPEFLPVIDSYRKIDVCYVVPDSTGQVFSRDWLRRFAAMEALSCLPRTDRALKMLRTKIPHGLDFHSFEDDQTSENMPLQDALPEEIADTASVWLEALAGPMEERVSLYDLPSLTAAVRLIEGYTARGEKVLVFGRFVEPLRALTRLLDAREMLRRLRDDSHWPGATLPKEEQAREAIRVAMRDPGVWNGSQDLADLEVLLKARYTAQSNRREAELARLRREVAQQADQGNRLANLLVSLWQRQSAGAVSLPALLEALEVRRDNSGADNVWSCTTLLEAFAELLEELSDIETSDEDGAVIEARPDDIETRLKQHLAEFSLREGNHARLMYGATSAQARRNLQAGFNRLAAWPMVLLAQSLVGREGLNLHEACATVVLLHSEWNPGVVEQQIGRVDRKNSLWLKRLRRWQADGQVGEMPRINIHPIVISGTYDARNWSVLESRWKLLRGQLHGNVLPPPGPNARAAEWAWSNRIRTATPRFSPLAEHGLAPCSKVSLNETRPPQVILRNFREL